MNTLDRIRIEWALTRFSFYLDIRFIARKRRKELKGELRANLNEAQADQGMREALVGLGSIWVLAAQYRSEGTDRPRWAFGFTVALSIFAAGTILAMLAALNWADGALALDSGAMVEGGLFPFPGSQVSVVDSGSGLSVAFALGWLPPALAAVGFVLAAKPWRIRAWVSGAATAVDV